MNDLISRADAIKAIFEAFSTGDEGADRYIAEKILADVPSAQTEQAVKDCRNCKHGAYNDHWETHFCYNPNECTEWNLWEPIAQPEWNNHTVACLLADLFDDTCACNYNSINEWLPEKCEVIGSCPNPVGVACWEQFLKHRVERRTDE